MREAIVSQLPHNPIIRKSRLTIYIFTQEHILTETVPKCSLIWCSPNFICY